MGPILAVLGRSWALCCQSWAALEANVAGLGLLLGPMLAVLGRSWGLCWRSWAALSAYVGGLGPSVGGLGPMFGGPWRPQAQKWPKPEREGDLGRDQGPPKLSKLSSPRGLLRIYSIDTAHTLVHTPLPKRCRQTISNNNKSSRPHTPPMAGRI